jgi:TrmH family RNA methyltransferase
VKHVTSADNAAFKALRRLVQSSQARREAGQSVLDGAHLVAAYLDRLGPPQQMVVSRTGLDTPEIQALLARARGVATLVLRDSLFDGLSPVVSPTGIMAVVATPRSPTLPARLDACVMLEAVQDPGNLGSILRSCAAAGMRDVLLSRETVNAWSPRVLRAAMGAHFYLDIHERVDLVAVAGRYTGMLIATRQDARESLFDAELSGRVGFLFGNEGAGLSGPLLRAAGRVVAIPMPGGTESLNVAAAVAVCLFERVRQIAASSDQ